MEQNSVHKHSASFKNKLITKRQFLYSMFVFSFRKKAKSTEKKGIWWINIRGIMNKDDVMGISMDPSWRGRLPWIWSQCQCQVCPRPPPSCRPRWYSPHAVRRCCWGASSLQRSSARDASRASLHDALFCAEPRLAAFRSLRHFRWVPLYNHFFFF